MRLVQFDLDFPSRKLVEMRDHLWGLICVRRARRDTISGERRMPRCSDGPTPGRILHLPLGAWAHGRKLPLGALEETTPAPWYLRYTYPGFPGTLRETDP